jgi:hypothetical protein
MMLIAMARTKTTLIRIIAKRFLPAVPEDSSGDGSLDVPNSVLTCVQLLFLPIMHAAPLTANQERGEGAGGACQDDGAGSIAFSR